jgi:integrase
VAERRVDGKTVRRTLGKAVGAASISVDAARTLQITISSELQKGVDRAEVKREKRQAEKQEATTLADAVKAYVKGKRRGKDGLPLKARTKADYEDMVERGGIGKIRKDGTGGEPLADGLLYPLAAKSIYRITADDMRKVYAAALARGGRRATYAMQVLRAVLNWHGVIIPDSPLSKTTAGKDRIVLPPTGGDPTPIPPEKLGPWWRAAMARAGSPSADGCRFMLLTGCRPGEVFGSEHEQGLLVAHVDLVGGRVTLPDTKNRRAHVVALSTQASAILKTHCTSKKPKAKVFDVVDPAYMLDCINSEAGVEGITPHKLRHTFASVAEELVSGYALKKMLNHSNTGDDVTARYVGKGEAQLRRAWQTVADFIEESGAARPDPAPR